MLATCTGICPVLERRTSRNVRWRQIAVIRHVLSALCPVMGQWLCCYIHLYGGEAAEPYRPRILPVRLYDVASRRIAWLARLNFRYSRLPLSHCGRTGMPIGLCSNIPEMLLHCVTNWYLRDFNAAQTHFNAISCFTGCLDVSRTSDRKLMDIINRCGLYISKPQGGKQHSSQSSG